MEVLVKKSALFLQNAFSMPVQGYCNFASKTVSKKWRFPVARNRNRRPTHQDEPPHIEEIDASPEEIELADFLDSLGPQGISEVSLYRILPSGKQRFITSGPPSQFSEQAVQTQFGAGDYLARAKLDGRWYKSKSFSVEAPPGTVATNAPPLMPNNHDTELERLKAQIESQRLEMERDRQAREQRNHELQLKMLEALGSRGNQAAGPSLTELIAGVQSLRNLAEKGGATGLGGFKEMLDIADRVNSLRGGDGKDDSWPGMFKSIAPEAVQAVVQLLSSRVSPSRAVPPGATPSPNGAQNPAAPVAEHVTTAVAPLPTAYDAIAGQLRAL